MMLSSVVYVNGERVNNIEFSVATIQQVRLDQGTNEVRDTKGRYHLVDHIETTKDGAVFYLIG